MTKLLAKVTVRNTYRVVQDPSGDYRLTNKDPNGQSYCHEVPGKVVEYVYKQFRGNTVTVKDTESLLDRAPKKLHVPCSSAKGHKLNYYAQYALLALVATGRASHLKCGRKFEYTVFTVPKKPQGAQRKLSVTRRRSTR